MTGKWLVRLMVLTAAAAGGYYTGRLLSERDFTGEQEYIRGLRLRLDLDDGHGFAMWSRVSNLPAAGPEDRVFEVDEQTGQLVFGDGEHGRRPPADTGTVKAEYRRGSH